MLADTVPNEILLLDLRLSQSKNEVYPYATDDEFFLLSSIDTILRHRGLSYQQIEEGITEGSDDGGIDAVYTFLNGVLVEDEAVAVAGHSALELEIIQVKNERGFKESALQRLIDHLPLLLQLEPSRDLNLEFNERIRERFGIFRATYLQASTTFPVLTIRVRYVTKSVEPPNLKVGSKQKRLEEKVCESLRDANAVTEFIGAVELNNKARERLNTTYELRVSEGPISAEKGGFVCLVTLADWYRFIIDSEGRLRDEVFEENVRGYEGDTIINRGIGESLRQGDSSAVDFWWLNNGVTVLGTRVQTPGKRFIIEDAQVVNGLQTSRNIYQYFNGTKASEATEGTKRHLLVRIIEAQEDVIMSQIIKATNSQNRVSVATLRATEPFQRSIEEYFSRHGYFYERKKNQYKNQGKPRSQIVEVLELAQAVAAILLHEPHMSRGQPSALVRDRFYGRVFNENTPLQAFLNCVLIVRKIDKYLEKQFSNRQQRGNVRYQLARAATAVALSSSRPRAIAIARLQPDAFDTWNLKPVFDWILVARRSAERAAGTEDENVLAKSAEWSKEISRRLSRYTDKTRWPKKLTAGWNYDF